MNNKIDYVIEHDRFPLSRMDWVFLILVFIVVSALAITASFYLENILASIVVLIAAVLLCFTIYKGYLTSLVFKKIHTNFSKAQNQKLIVYCMAKLNFKLFKDKVHDNVFVCFIHEKVKNDRQEIYLIAKEKYILINSDREKDADNEQGTQDFVDRIGMNIFRTAKEFNRKYNRV